MEILRRIFLPTFIHLFIYDNVDETGFCTIPQSVWTFVSRTSVLTLISLRLVVTRMYVISSMFFYLAYSCFYFAARLK